MSQPSDTAPEATAEARSKSLVPKWLAIKPIKSMTPEEREVAFRRLGQPVKLGDGPKGKKS